MQYIDKTVTNFKYLGSQAWSAIHKMKLIRTTWSYGHQNTEHENEADVRERTSTI